MFQKASKFAREAYQELRLSAWLTRQQMVASTIVVLVLTVIVALFIAGIDYVLLYAARIILTLS